MKKYRFFSAGSLNENIFLKKMLNQGYILEKTGLFSYTFKKAPKLNNYDLVVEYSDKNLTTIEPDMKNELNLLSLVEKKLFLAKYYVIYSYVKKNKKSNSNSISTDSDLIELNYLKNFFENFRSLRSAVTVILTLLWGLTYLFNDYLNLSFSLWQINIILILLLVFWILTNMYLRSCDIFERVYILQEKTGNFSGCFPARFTIVIKNQDAAPDIDKLSFLGYWKLVSARPKKRDYYYRLKTLSSEDDIKENICTVLNINEKDIVVISSMGLFPLGYH